MFRILGMRCWEYADIYLLIFFIVHLMNLIYLLLKQICVVMQILCLSLINFPLEIYLAELAIDGYSTTFQKSAFQRF